MKLELNAQTIGIGLIALSLITNRGEMAEKQTQRKVIATARIETAHAQEEATIADQRFTQGCVPIVSLENGKPIAITPGLPIYDQNSGLPWPSGTIVCDGFGNTSVLESATTADGKAASVVGEIISTGNRSIVEASMQQWPQELQNISMPRGTI